MKPSSDRSGRADRKRFHQRSGVRVLARALCAVLCGCGLAGRAVAATEPVHYGVFGNVHAARPPGAIERTVIFVSAGDGWDARAEALAGALAANGALVLGVDLPDYLKRLQAIDEKCAFPAGHFEEMSDWMQRHYGLENFTYPLIIGDGAGATFAYAVDAQAPAGTFVGLVTLGFDLEFRLPKAICPGDAGALTAAGPNGRFRVVPVKRLPNPWLPLPFAPSAGTNGLLAPAGSVLRALARQWPAPVPTPRAPEAVLADAVTHWQDGLNPVIELPGDVADLPLIEISAQGEFAQRVAVILTGDGGWAGLDVAVADQLAQRGIAVVGLSTLKFFWHKRSAQETTDALVRIIAHYAQAHPQADFVVLGYSFGAGLAPVLINRVPDAVSRLIAAQVLISPDPEAVFEVKVGDWFGAAHHDDAVPVEPEIARTRVPVICVHGAEEGAASLCMRIAHQPKVSLIELPGGHHYNGDYDKLGAAIAAHLPPRAGNRRADGR